MNDQIADQPTLTRRMTDSALLVIAVAAIATWVWRRLRRPAIVDAATSPADVQVLDDKIGGAVGFPPSNAAV